MTSEIHDRLILQTHAGINRRIKVLHFTACPDGGPKRHILDIVRNVPAERIESIGAFIDPAKCAVLGVDPEDTYAKHFRKLGLRCFLLDFPRNLNPWKDLKTLFTLIGILRRERPDVLHCHSSKAGVIGRIAGLCSPGCSVYYSPHGIWFFWQNGIKRVIYYWLEWLFSFACTALIAVSPSEEATLKKYFAGRRIIRINNGVDSRAMSQTKPERSSLLRQLGIPATARIALTVTRLEPVKNVSSLLEGFALVPNSDQLPIHLLIAGDGKLKQTLEEQTAQLGIRDRVHFLGWRNDIPRLIAASDCVVLTSHAEGLPYSLLEAGALARPVVATRVNGSIDIVEDGRSGLLFQLGDIQALAAHMTRILSDPIVQHRFGAAGREVIDREFAVEGMWKAYADLYSLGEVRSPVYSQAATAGR